MTPIEFFSRFFIFITCLLTIACSNKKSPEEQVHNYLSTATTVSTSRDISDFKNLISDNYRDSYAHNKNDLTRLAAGYFIRNKNIHLFKRIKNIYFSANNKAEVQLYIAMTGTPIENSESLINLRADIYQFDLVLIKENKQWKLFNARWSRAEKESFF